MGFDSLITIVQESLYLILVFCAFLGYAMIKGKQSLINLILGLYLALLISLEFPYYDVLLNGTLEERMTDSLIMIAVFAFFTIAATFLFAKLMPQDTYETAFEGFGKKALFALLATVLVMAYSYHALPITDIFTPGSPVQALFGAEEHFFWWMLVPLGGLFLL